MKKNYGPMNCVHFNVCLCYGNEPKCNSACGWFEPKENEYDVALRIYREYRDKNFTSFKPDFATWCERRTEKAEAAQRQAVAQQATNQSAPCQHTNTSPCSGEYVCDNCGVIMSTLE